MTRLRSQLDQYGAAAPSDANPSLTDDWGAYERESPLAREAKALVQHLRLLGKPPLNMVVVLGVRFIGDGVLHAAMDRLCRHSMVSIRESRPTARSVREAIEASGRARPIWLQNAESLFASASGIAALHDLARSGCTAIVSTAAPYEELLVGSKSRAERIYNLLAEVKHFKLWADSYQAWRYTCVRALQHGLIDRRPDDVRRPLSEPLKDQALAIFTRDVHRYHVPNPEKLKSVAELVYRYRRDPDRQERAIQGLWDHRAPEFKEAPPSFSEFAPPAASEVQRRVPVVDMPQAIGPSGIHELIDVFQTTSTFSPQA